MCDLDLDIQLKSKFEQDVLEHVELEHENTEPTENNFEQKFCSHIESKLCRLCTANLSPETTINIRKRRGLETKIEKITYISVSKMAELPQNICTACYKMIHIVTRFQAFCEKNQKVLERMINKVDENAKMRPMKTKQVNWCLEAEQQFELIAIKETLYEGETDQSINQINDHSIDAEKEEDTDIFDEQLTKGTEIECKKQNGYSCDWCYSFFKTETELWEHQNEERSANRIKPNNVIGFQNENKVKVEVWECCNHKYKVQKNYAKHMKQVHNTNVEVVKRKAKRIPRATQCDICGKLVTTRIAQHKFLSHEVSSEKCSYKECSGKIFRNRHRLQVHILRVHTKTAHKECNICGKSFHSWDKVRKHIKAVHENYRPFVCKECNKAFQTQFNLNMHLKVHSREANFQCSYCDKLFVYKHILKIHIEREHLVLNKIKPK